MAQILVRNVEEKVKRRIQLRARQHGWSMEEELRAILRSAAHEDEARSGGLGTEIAHAFADADFEVEISELRGYTIKPPSFK